MLLWWFKTVLEKRFSGKGVGETGMNSPSKSVLLLVFFIFLLISVFFFTGAGSADSRETSGGETTHDSSTEECMKDCLAGPEELYENCMHLFRNQPGLREFCSKINYSNDDAKYGCLALTAWEIDYCDKIIDPEVSLICGRILDIQIN